MSMKVDITKVKSILELVREHTDDLTIDIMADGITFSVRGMGGTTMVRGKLLPDFFTEYPVIDEGMELSFSTSSLLEALKGIKGEATMSYDKVTCDIMISAGRVRKSFRVGGGESQTAKKPNISYTTELSLTAPMVKEIIEVIKSSDSKGSYKATTVTLTDSTLKFEIPGKTVCEWVATTDEVEAKGSGRSTYDSSFLTPALSAIKLCDTLKVYFADDYPMMIVATDKESVEDSTMLFQQIIAPRLGD